MLRPPLLGPSLYSNPRILLIRNVQVIVPCIMGMMTHPFVCVSVCNYTALVLLLLCSVPVAGVTLLSPILLRHEAAN